MEPDCALLGCFQKKENVNNSRLFATHLLVPSAVAAGLDEEEE